MARALGAWAINRREKTRAVIYSTALELRGMYQSKRHGRWHILWNGFLSVWVTFCTDSWRYLGRYGLQVLFQVLTLLTATHVTFTFAWSVPVSIYASFITCRNCRFYVLHWNVKFKNENQLLSPGGSMMTRFSSGDPQCHKTKTCLVESVRGCFLRFVSYLFWLPVYGTRIL